MFDTFSPYKPSLNFSDDNVEDNVDEDEDVVNILEESELEIEDIDDVEKLKKLGMDYLKEIFLIFVLICMCMSGHILFFFRSFF